MAKKCFVAASLLATLLACKNQQTENSPAAAYDPCTNGRDTVIRRTLAYDTATKDFYRLLHFIESKTDFSRFDRKRTIDNSTATTLQLTKLLCREKDFDSPTETWRFDSVFSIRYLLTLNKPVKEQKDFYPKVDITQFNFATEAERQAVSEKLKEIGWGDPFKKWNDYYIITGKKRIIVLQSYVALFSETKNKLGDLLRKEWENR
jgi:hypothetical protein